MPKKKQPNPVGRPPKYSGDRVRVLLQLPGDLARKLAKAATKLGLSRTEAIQRAIAEWLGGGR